VPLIPVNGTLLNVQQIQQKSDLPKRDIILPHGLASAMGFWMRSYVEELSPFFRITMLDMRGHGRSRTPATGYSPDALADDIRGVMDELEIETAHFMGHSFGGIIPLKLAVTHPGRVQSLILLDSQIGLGRQFVKVNGWAEDQEFVAAMKALDLKVDKDDPFYGVQLISQITNLVRSGNITETDDERLNAVLSNLSMPVAKKWGKLEEESDALDGFATDDGITEEDLRALTIPTLGIYGERSAAKFSGEALIKFIPNAQRTIIPKAGHFFAARRPEEVLTHAFDFWNISDVRARIKATHKVA